MLQLLAVLILRDSSEPVLYLSYKVVITANFHSIRITFLFMVRLIMYAKILDAALTTIFRNLIGIPSSPVHFASDVY